MLLSPMYGREGSIFVLEAVLILYFYLYFSVLVLFLGIIVCFLDCY